MMIEALYFAFKTYQLWDQAPAVQSKVDQLLFVSTATLFLGKTVLNNALKILTGVSLKEAPQRFWQHVKDVVKISKNVQEMSESFNQNNFNNKSQ